MSGVPNVTDEIERKTIGAIAQLMKAYQSGEIAYREMYIGIKSVWDATSGLVSKNVMDTMVSLMNEGLTDRTDTFVFRLSNGTYAVVRHWVMSHRVDVLMPNSPPISQQWSVSHCQNPSTEAYRALNVMLSAMDAIGERI